MLNRWINEYIEDIDLRDIKWINLNYEEFGMFLKENYYDFIDKTYVTDKKINSSYFIPLGMCYLYYTDTLNDYKYILGVVKNKKGKYTIISAVIFLDNIYISKEQVNPMTFLCSIEVNSFFRRKGIMKKTCEFLSDFIPNNQDIIVSKESEMGKKCNSFSTIYSCITKKNLDINVFSEEEFDKNIYQKTNKDKTKVLKRNR